MKKIKYNFKQFPAIFHVKPGDTVEVINTANLHWEITYAGPNRNWLNVCGGFKLGSRILISSVGEFNKTLSVAGTNTGYMCAEHFKIVKLGNNHK